MDRSKFQLLKSSFQIINIEANFTLLIIINSHQLSFSCNFLLITYDNCLWTHIKRKISILFIRFGEFFFPNLDNYSYCQLSSKEFRLKKYSIWILSVHFLTHSIFGVTNVRLPCRLEFRMEILFSISHYTNFELIHSLNHIW